MAACSIATGMTVPPRATRPGSKTSRRRARAIARRNEVYRDLRASAESGWDFSSRWFADGRTLKTIRTTDIVPVDLNSLLFQLESTIARGCQLAKRPDCHRDMTAQAKARQKAVQKLLWDEEQGVFVDYDFRADRRLTQITIATAYPLFVGLARESASAASRQGHPRYAAAAPWRGHHRRRHGPAMGRPEWLGAAPVDSHRWPSPLWRRRAGGNHRRALGEGECARLLPDRQAGREVQRARRRARARAASIRCRTALAGPMPCS